MLQSVWVMLGSDKLEKKFKKKISWGGGMVGRWANGPSDGKEKAEVRFFLDRV